MRILLFLLCAFAGFSNTDACDFFDHGRSQVYSELRPHDFLDSTLTARTQTIRTRDEIFEAGEVFARAFYDYVLWKHFFPEGPKREAALEWLMPRIINIGVRTGQVIAITNTDGSIRGAAIWNLTHKTGNLWDDIRSGLLKAPRHIGFKNVIPLERLKGYLVKVRRKYCSGGCYYLTMMAIDPVFQKQGLSRELLEPAIRASERDNIPLFLDTQSLDNVAIYKRMGFTLVEHGMDHETKGILNYFMIRYPSR